MHSGMHTKDLPQLLGIKIQTLLPIKGWKDGESAAINYSYFSPYDSLYAPMAAALAKASQQNLNPQQTRDYVLELCLQKMDL